jgi:hypothetical protein
VRPSTDFAVTNPATLVGQRLSVGVARHAALGPLQGVGLVTSNWQAAQGYWGREMSEKGMTHEKSLDKSD